MVGLIKLPMAEPSLSDAIHGQRKFHRDIYRVLRVPERILSPIMRWTQNSHYAPANPHEIKIDSKKRGSWARHTDSPMYILRALAFFFFTQAALAQQPTPIPNFIPVCPEP
jgi:hypothetical protein